MTKYYNLDSDNKFIWSVDGTYIWVSEIDDINARPVKNSNWDHMDVSIGPHVKYEGLRIFGVEIGSGSLLKDLADHLAGSLLMVNREGFCFLNIEPLTDPSLGIQYYRLNDLFEWSVYHVKPTIRTRWNRWGIDTGALISIVGIIDKHEEDARERISGKKPNHQNSKGNDTNSSTSANDGGNSSNNSAVGDDDDSDDDDDSKFIDIVANKKKLIPQDKLKVSKFRQQFPFSKPSSTKLPKFKPLNKDVRGRFPMNVQVHTSNGEFDRDQWWAIEAKSGKETTMLAFYGGARAILDFPDDSMYLPYDDDEAALTTDRNFFVAQLRGFGACLAFKYT